MDASLLFSLLFAAGLGIGVVIGFIFATVLKASFSDTQLVAAAQREQRLVRNYDRMTEAALQHAGVAVVLYEEPTSVMEPAPGWFARKSDPSFFDKAPPNAIP